MEKKYIGNGLEISDLKEIAAIVKENGLGKLELKCGDFEIIIEGKKEYPPQPPVFGTPNSGTMVHSPAAIVRDSETAVSSVPSAPAVVNGNVVKSPIVGTYYASSAPDKPPFVTVGQKVKKGDVLMIIESMKVMNDVQSDFDGTVTEILIKNAESVEYDQPIMVIA